MSLMGMLVAGNMKGLSQRSFQGTYHQNSKISAFGRETSSSDRFCVHMLSSHTQPTDSNIAG